LLDRPALLRHHQAIEYILSLCLKEHTNQARDDDLADKDSWRESAAVTLLRSAGEKEGLVLPLLPSMLSRQFRLASRKDIMAVIRRGRKIATPHVLLYVCKNHERTSSRVACIVGKRVDASAVRRHRIQRWMREIARETISSLPQTLDMVWLALPSAREIRHKSELQESLAPHFQKLHKE
jgi:ribonuclease P protein component